MAAWLSNFAFIASVATVMVCVNIVFSALLKVLGLIAARPGVDWSDKAYAVGQKIAPFLQKAAEWASGNLEHGKDIPTTVDTAVKEVKS